MVQNLNARNCGVRNFIVIGFLSWLLPLTSGHAQPVEQVFTLNPGWNAVFLRVDPVSDDPADVFAGIPDLVSVWRWNSRTSMVEFIQDPSTLMPTHEDWLVYLPDNPIVTTLHAAYGGRPYLINLHGMESVEWRVTGEPLLPRFHWKHNSFNLVGFPLEPGREPLFGDFFSSSPAHAGQEIYTLNDAGRWELLANPDTSRMTDGEAFWIYTEGHSDFVGPLAIDIDLLGGLHFGSVLSSQPLRLKNRAAADAAVSITLMGEVPLDHWRFEPSQNDVGWREFPLGLSIVAGEQETVRTGARRSGLTSGQRYDGNLVIMDGAGMRIIVPASVEGISLAGLWAGEVRVSKVSEPRVAPDQDFPLVSDDRSYATATTFSFRIIVHVDENGNARLLKQIIQMWDETQKRHVLFSDAAKIPLYTATESSLRISSAAFSVLSPTEPRFEAPMSGLFGEGGNLAVTVTLAQDDPANPFRHQYHPDHKAPADVYEVIRNLELIFSPVDGEGQPINSSGGVAWGTTQLGGIYRETLSGLHRTPIKVEGIFVMEKISDISVLD